MNDYKEQYRQELIYQEIKSNKYTFKGFLWFVASLGVIWLLTMIDFFEVDKLIISISFISTIVVFLLPLFIYLKTDLSQPWIKYCFLTLICIAAGILVSFLSFHAVLVYVLPLLFAVQYRRQSIIWFVYFINTITMLISSLISFFYGLCDLNILLESQHVRSWYMNTITDNSLNIPFNDNPISIIILFEVFPRSIVLLVFSIMMCYAVVNSSEDAFTIAKLTYLKETDIKTNVFNKNKYEEMIQTYYPKMSQVGVIFWDLNNLKIINDQYGHDMGDKAIEKLSSAINYYSSERRRTYRVGGDEFVMIIDNPEEGEETSIIKSINESLNKEKIDGIINASCAAGSAVGQGKDIREIIKKADTLMYQNKKCSKEARD